MLQNYKTLYAEEKKTNSSLAAKISPQTLIQIHLGSDLEQEKQEGKPNQNIRYQLIDIMKKGLVLYICVVC